MWLNKFKVNGPLRVLYIEQERAAVETRRRFKALMAEKGLTGKDVPGLKIMTGSSIRLNLPQSFDAFKIQLADFKPDLVIWDSLATAHTSEENNRKEIQAVLEKVKELRNEFGCTFIFVHHENKHAFNNGDDAGEPSIAQMAGSVAIPAVAEFVLTVRKTGEDMSMVYNTKNTTAKSLDPFSVQISDTEKGIRLEAI